jgi:hypothetical protein
MIASLQSSAPRGDYNRSEDAKPKKRYLLMLFFVTPAPPGARNPHGKHSSL